VLTDQLGVEAESRLEAKYALQVFTDLEQALDQKPTVVFVCNPTSLHISTALRAAQAGCHLFMEKPISHNYEQIDELIDVVERRQLVSLVGYQMRFHPCFQRLADLLRQGAVGRVLAVRVEVGEYLPGWHRYEDYRQMYASRSELGGGVILSQIHELDYCYGLWGLPRRVFTLGGHLSSLEIDVEDVASTLMDYVIDGQAVPVHVYQDYVQRPPSRSCQVIGDSGKLIVDFRALSVTRYDSEGNAAEVNTYEGLQRNQLFLDELQHFLACLEGKQSPRVTLREGAQSLRLALAAKESLATGQVIELPR
jgi:predicted dehydrogenase